ncbi:sensor histidine kinase [Pseudaestuariivita atlantica]|uniref:histidine kinase n=1 Tax=Pseudaestuariivita atlantica TaxID=1317121 RepID=A0A0L1JW32_9RHOB|nr:ATP-binding protein [Pseudaestuariivita atlantica]KNG95613.1 ATPase [Pseudaestuariivita atlantica]
MDAAPAQTILDGLPLAAVLIGPSERIEQSNAEARALLGEAIGGRHFITAIRQPAVLDAVEQTIRDGGKRTTRYLTRTDGQDISYDVTASQVSLTGQNAVLVTFNDVTHLERAGQMRRDFVANVSHELRTPLTALIGFIETLRGPARDDAEARERFLATMADEAHRMNRLVADLLSLSRVETDERVRPTDRVKPADIVTTILHRLEPLAEAAGATLSADLPAQDVALPGDEDQLGQVIGNLVENAIKYGGRGVSVTVTVSAPAYEPQLRGTGVRLSVADTGPGIDPVHIPRLTERFYRVDDHRSREVGGTGLGLAIVKHIVNRHRGRLRIDSALEKGTIFTIILPVEAPGAGHSVTSRGAS